MLIYATQRNLQILSTARHWLMDGIFEIVPELFFQLYTIHAVCGLQSIPSVYGLLPNKRQVTYMSFLQKLKEADATLNPDTVTTDYEVATINALQEVFPDTHEHGCLYHLSLCVYRRVQANGLQQSYTTDNELSLQIRMIPALAFAPVADVPATFELIQEDLPEELQPILDYFEDTFIGRARHRGRREPRFQYSMWNCHDRVGEGFPRTNNHCEGWHRRMSASVGAYHPNIWVFLDVLKEGAVPDRSSHDTDTGWRR